MNNCFDNFCNISQTDGVDVVGVSFQNSSKFCHEKDGKASKDNPDFRKAILFYKLAWITAILTPIFCAIFSAKTKQHRLSNVEYGSSRYSHFSEINPSYQEEDCCTISCEKHIQKVFCIIFVFLFKLPVMLMWMYCTQVFQFERITKAYGFWNIGSFICFLFEILFSCSLIIDQ